MYQDVKVAVISRDVFFSNALRTLFMLERISCAALELEKGLTHAVDPSIGCIVFHADAEIPRSHIVEWLELGMGVIVLSEILSKQEVLEILKVEPSAVLSVPVNSKDLLDVVYSVLTQVGQSRS